MNYRETDPEFAERFEHFAFEEVVNEEGQQLDDVTRNMAILAALLGCQGVDEFRLALPRALDQGLTPVMVKEIVYQAVDYLGIGRVLPFLNATNEILTERGVKLPLEGQATTTMENRLEKRRPGAGRHFWRRHERRMEKRPYQPLACGELFRRLLYQDRAQLCAEGDDYFLLPGRAGRMRAAAYLPCGRKYEGRER